MDKVQNKPYSSVQEYYIVIKSVMCILTLLNFLNRIKGFYGREAVDTPMYSLLLMCHRHVSTTPLSSCYASYGTVSLYNTGSR
jgi:hypothetical protein